MHKHRRDAGFSLAALIFFATAASILAAAAVPAYQMQAKREREKELIFRGEEYARAILKYQKKFGVYPTSVDQLIQTNGIRFLRHAYKDPITGKDFRLLRLNPDGRSISNSKLSLSANSKPLFADLPGVVPNPSTQAQPNQPPPPGRQPPPSPGISIGNPIGTPIGGGPIVGVASDSDEASVMVYNQHQRYSELEITINSLAGQQRGPQIPGQVPGQQIPGLQLPGQQVPGQPGVPGQPPTPGMPGQFSTPGVPGQFSTPGSLPPNVPFSPPIPGSPASPVKRP